MTPEDINRVARALYALEHQVLARADFECGFGSRYWQAAQAIVSVMQGHEPLPLPAGTGGTLRERIEALMTAFMPHPQVTAGDAATGQAVAMGALLKAQSDRLEKTHGPIKAQPGLEVHEPTDSSNTIPLGKAGAAERT